MEGARNAEGVGKGPRYSSQTPLTKTISKTEDTFQVRTMKLEKTRKLDSSYYQSFPGHGHLGSLLRFQHPPPNQTRIQH